MSHAHVAPPPGLRRVTGKETRRASGIAFFAWTIAVYDFDDDWKRAKRAQLPLGRFGLPEEIGPTAVLLASDPGGNLFVGQVLGPNSGDVMP